MSVSKKLRALNRARVEHDNAKLSMQFAANKNTMNHIADSVMARHIEAQAAQITALEEERIIDEQRVADLMTQVGNLAAQIEQKNAALKRAAMHVRPTCGDLFDQLMEALHSTPNEALQAFAEKVREQCIGIVESYKVSVGNSASGELAAEWTMQNLKEIRDEIRNLKELPK